MDELEIPGLGGPDAAIRLAPGANVSRLSLTGEEMSLIAAIRGEVAIREVIRRSGLPAGRAQTTLVALRRKRVIEPVDADSTPTPPPTPSTGTNRAVEADPADLLDPNCDLEPERRREISLLHAQLETLSHYDLLGVPPRADARAVKDAYFERSKRFHPDRFFGKRLGRLKPKVEAIFRAITKASDVLSDPAQRKAYDAARVEATTSSEERAILEARAAERRARLVKRSPYLQRLGTASEFERRARQLLQQEKWAQASADFAAAAALDPANKELPQLAADAKRRAELAQAEELVSQADLLHAQGNERDALEKLARAGALATKSVKVLRRVVPALLDGGRDPNECKELAQRWTEAAPTDADAFASLGRALLTIGDEKAGKRALEKALSLDSKQPYARSVLRKFWPF